MSAVVVKCVIDEDGYETITVDGRKIYYGDCFTSYELPRILEAIGVENVEVEFEEEG